MNYTRWSGMIFSMAIMLSGLAQGGVTIKPSHPQDGETFSVAPSDTAVFEVTIEDDSGYVLKWAYCWTVPESGSDGFVWLGGRVNKRLFSFSIMNSDWITETAIANVTCRWAKAITAGGGGISSGGGPAAPDEIEGLAVGRADAEFGQYKVVAFTNRAPAGAGVGVKAIVEYASGEPKGVASDWTVDGAGELQGSGQGVAVIQVKGANTGAATATGVCCLNGATDSDTITFVGVQSVSCQTVTSTTNEPGANQTLYVAWQGTGQTFAVSAAADPGTPWPAGNPAWSGATADTNDPPAQATVTLPGPGEYLVRASCGDSAKALKIAVIKVEFKEDVTYSGYDDSVDPNWIMAPKSGNNTALTEITPSATANQVNFESADTGKATVSPTTASSSPQIIIVSGVAKGETEVHAKPGSSGAACSTLRVTIKEQVNKTVAIHAITEDNDDIQIILVGKGQAGQTCITSGTNGVLNTWASGDDTVSGDTITTGPDGICNTTAAGDDSQVIAVNQGKPNAICVTKGTNNFRDTIPSGDDTVNGDSIDTGTDGICNTVANSTDVVPYNVPSAASLQSYLNGIYGSQADVFFTVTRCDHELNYDLDRNGGVPDPPNESEMNEIATGAASTGVDTNIYFVRVMDAPIATTRISQDDAFIQSETGGTAENVAAHELGHILGLSHNDTEAINLMHSSSENGCQLQKFEWDTVNP